MVSADVNSDFGNFYVTIVKVVDKRWKILPLLNTLRFLVDSLSWLVDWVNWSLIRPALEASLIKKEEKKR